MNQRTKKKPELLKTTMFAGLRRRDTAPPPRQHLSSLRLTPGPSRNARSLPRFRRRTSLLPDLKSQAPPPNRKQERGRPLPAAAPCAGAVAYLRTKRSRFNRDAVRKRRLYLRGPEADVRETVCASAVTFRRALGGPPAWLRCGGPEAERVTVWLQTHIRLASAADPICSRLTRESGFRREVRPQNTLSTGSLLAL